MFPWFELQVAHQCLWETFAESQVPEADDGFRAHGIHVLLSQNTISIRRTCDFSDKVADAIARPRAVITATRSPHRRPSTPLESFKMNDKEAEHSSSSGSSAHGLRRCRSFFSDGLASITARIASRRLCTSSRKASTVGDDGARRRQLNRNSAGAEAGCNRQNSTRPPGRTK